MQVSLNKLPAELPVVAARPRLIPLTAQALPLSSDGSPPTDFMLIPTGPMRTEYGTFEWTARSARSVAAQWEKRGRRFMWDYEHFSTKTDALGNPITDVHARRAAGNATPVSDLAGFRMQGQTWTPDAAAYIRNGEFIYYSPVIGVDEKTGEIIDVLKSALTNDPATLGCAPLMLSADVEFTALTAELAATVGHVMDGCEDTKGQGEPVALAENAVQSNLHSDKLMRAADATEPYPDDKIPGVYDPNTDPSVPGSAASKLPSLSSVPPTPATHGPPHDSDVPLASMTQPTQPTAAQPAAQPATAAPVSLSVDSDKHVRAMAEHPHGAPAKHEIASVLVHNADTGHTLWGRRNDSNKYTAPGGHIRDNEQPVDGAARELKEETGLDLPRHQLSYMGTVRLSHPANGSPMDVHGYSCTVPPHVALSVDKDPHKEVKAWEWHAEHPVDMDAPVNALSVLSAKNAKRMPVPASSETPHKTPGANADAQTHELGSHALDDDDTEMDMNTLKALTATLLTSSGEGLSADIEQKRQVALSAVKALDDALVTAGHKDGAVDIGTLISLSTKVEEVTGAKTGQVGAIISLAARAEAQPLALQLSQDQLKANYVELAFNAGRINGKTRADVTAKIKSLSLADCEQLNKGPKIYTAPNGEPAPQGDNSATRTVELVGDNRQPAANGQITATPPADLLGKKVELTVADHSAIAAAKSQGITIDPAKLLASKQAYADQLAQAQQSRAQSGKNIRMLQHPAAGVRQ